MRIPPIECLGHFVVRKNKMANLKKELPFPPVQKDTVSFSSSKAYYLKKYNTLPDEIKKLLTPKDAIDMFQNMEQIQKGMTEGIKIGQGDDSSVYENPWLDGYYIMIVQTPKKQIQTVYSRYPLGNSVWEDEKDNSLQIIKRA